MRVVGHDHEAVNGHRVEMLGLAENPEENVRWLGQWPELPPTLDGPGGDFDEDVSWNNSK